MSSTVSPQHLVSIILLKIFFGFANDSLLLKSPFINASSIEWIWNIKASQFLISSIGMVVPSFRFGEGLLCLSLASQCLWRSILSFFGSLSNHTRDLVMFSIDLVIQSPSVLVDGKFLLLAVINHYKLVIFRFRVK